MPVPACHIVRFGTAAREFIPFRVGRAVRRVEYPYRTAASDERNRSVMRRRERSFIRRSAPYLEPEGEKLGQAGGSDLVCGNGNIVGDPAECYRLGIGVVDAVGGAGIIVARLADASGIYDHASLNADGFFEVELVAGAGAAVALEKNHRHVGMPNEAERLFHRLETGESIVHRFYVVELVGVVEGGVDN